VRLDPSLPSGAPARPAIAPHRGWLPGVSAALVGGLAVLALATVLPRITLLHAASWLLVGFVLVPLGMVACLAAVAALLSLVTGAMALPWWLAGRPTGWPQLCAELWRLPSQILPRFARALAAVRPRWLWGLLLGAIGGMAVTLVRHGLQPQV
jgi:hypothetical protein